MAITNALASVAVNNLKASAPWYERLLGRPADSTTMPGVAEWRFDRGGGLQVYELRERAGSGSVTLAVSNLDHHLEQLRSLGIDPGRPIANTQVKVAMIKDPDGNSIAFAETTDPSLAH